MTSSSAILYPTFKGMESSNSSFVQVSHPVRDINRNLPSSLRYSASMKAERGNKSKQSKGNELHGDTVERNEEWFINRRQHRPVTVDEEIGDHSKHSSRYGRTSNVYSMPKLKVEKSQQYQSADIREESEITNTAMNGSMDSVNPASSEEIAEIKPESMQNLINKHPKHTIIINNTFINRPPTEQDDFLAKFSPNFYNKSLNIGSSVRDALPPVTEACHNEFEPLSVSEEKKADDSDMRSTAIEDCVSDHVNDASITDDKNVPLGSIITGILWIILILFWFLIYVKVLNVYNTKVVPKPEPTNYELCLMFIRKFGTFIGQLWKF